jgi:hypothetical protein
MDDLRLEIAAMTPRRTFASAEILPTVVGKPISSADGVNLLADRIRAFAGETARTFWSIVTPTTPAGREGARELVPSVLASSHRERANVVRTTDEIRHIMPTARVTAGHQAR